MKCENDKVQLTNWINNEMTDAERQAFEVHLAGCPDCVQELEAMQFVWNMAGEITVPEPSANMGVKFHAMLDAYKEMQDEKKNVLSGFVEKLKRLFTFQPGMQFTYSIVLVVVGIGFGYLFTRESTGYADKKQVAALSSEMHQMKEMMMLSLLENPSASERIKGVSYTNEVTAQNKDVIDALLTTLNNDPNVNVRLATLEALTHFSDNPAVREGLVQSIVQQESPLVQSALADTMKKLQDKRSIKSFRKLLQQKDLDQSVRSKIEKTITEII